MMLYAGLDVHKDTTYGTITDDEGKMIRQHMFKNTKDAFEHFFLGVPCKVVLENGSRMYPVLKILDELRYEYVVAHPNRIKAIASAKLKNDKVDSEILAHLLRSNLIPEVYLPKKEIQVLRKKSTFRRLLVKEKTKFKNHIHSILHKEGIKTRHTPFSKKWLKLLSKLDLEESNRAQIDHALDLLENIQEKINVYDTDLEENYASLPQIEYIDSVPDIGYRSASVIYGEIADINRFDSPKKLASYTGIVPSIRSSADKTY